MNILSRKLKEIQDNRKAVQEEIQLYRGVYLEARKKERLEQIPKLAKARVKEEMRVKLEKSNRGEGAIHQVGKVLAAGNRMSEALIGRPGEQAPTQATTKKRGWIDG